jgi:hypothetical protein
MLFAGIAQQARERFELICKRIHVDTTSFSVSGAYESDPEATEPACTGQSHLNKGSGKMGSKTVGRSDGTAEHIGPGKSFLIIKGSTGRENEAS